jgi:hypothetical protein
LEPFFVYSPPPEDIVFLLVFDVFLCVYPPPIEAYEILVTAAGATVHGVYLDWS